MLRRAVPFLIVFAACGAQAAELVTPAELQRSYFDGKPITTTDAKGHEAKVTFSTDGKVTRTTSRGRSSEGSWTASADGFCMKMGKAKNASCYLAIRDGKAVKIVRRSGSDFSWSR